MCHNAQFVKRRLTIEQDNIAIDHVTLYNVAILERHDIIKIF